MMPRTIVRGIALCCTLSHDRRAGILHWERISRIAAGLRTPLLVIGALMAITLGVFLIYPPAGFITAGAGLFVVEALTGPDPEVRRR